MQEVDHVETAPSILVESVLAPETDAQAFAGRTILVIDDDASQRDLMRRYLVAEGFSVEMASDGEEGLRLARRLRPLAITLDVMMPGIDGWSMLSRLKADPTLQGIPVIMLTMVDDKKRGYALGAANYMTKPVDRKGLSEILRKYSCSTPRCSALLVEDDESTRQMIRSVLEKSGWAVMEAENGKVALERVAENPPALIIIDLVMPVMDGIEFVCELHRNQDWSSIPMIVLTSEDLSQGDLHLLNGNVHAVLDKRGRPRKELMKEVGRLLSALAVPNPAPELA